jgi:hypothetical protein
LQENKILILLHKLKEIFAKNRKKITKNRKKSPFGSGPGMAIPAGILP